MNRPSHRSIARTSASALLTCVVAATSLSAESVAVRIETQKGRPIEGATVSVRDNEAGVVLDSAVTSDDGVAVIEALDPGEWYFEIDRPGYMLYTAYVQIRAGKKPELEFASQVSRGDDWEPMRVKFVKASTKMMREAVIAAPAEPRTRQTVRVEPEVESDAEAPVESQSRPDQRPDQMPAPDAPERAEPGPTTAETVAVPSTVETVEPETEAPQAKDPEVPELSVADGDPEPLAEEPEPATVEPESPAGADTLDQSAATEATAADAEEVASSAPDEGTLDPTPPEVVEPQPPIVDESDAALEAPAEGADQPAEPTQPEPQPLPEPASPQPSPQFEPTEEAESEATEQTALQPATEPPAADLPQPSRTVVPAPATAGALRSAAAGNCPECGAGEWAVSADVQAATAGDTRLTSTCAEDLGGRVQDFAQRLADRPQQPFAGPLMAALWRTPDDDDRAELAELGAPFNSPEGFCQVAGVVLPAGATMTGYALEAWDELGGRACNADGICALPKARWSGQPAVVTGAQATVIYATFRNRSTRHQRSAELTVLFDPPPEWQ